MTTLLQQDSRLVTDGDTFVAVCDQADLRSAHIVDAKKRGAQKIISEGGDSDLRCGHARYYLARLAARASGADQQHPPLIYVTGTDGKSTTVQCIQHCLGAGAARIGTLGMDAGSTNSMTSNMLTTPAAQDLHTFIQTLPNDCPGLAMEISSHGADQQRMAGLTPQVVVWTGISRDHLDYHKNFGHYLQAKLEIIRNLPAGALCVINADDEHAHVVEYAARCVGAQCISIGCMQGDIRLFSEDVDADTGIGRWRVYSQYADMPLVIPMVGQHNAWNALAAAVAVGALGIPLSTALARLADLPLIPGRMQLCAENPQCFVDYAHTPKALETVLASCRQSFPDKKIHLIFGCGGDRDHGKRAAMGTVATSADFIYITNDNPRSENPADIAAAICADYPCAQNMEELSKDKKFIVELDRAVAIQLAFAHAALCDDNGNNSIILIAGKGHESQQICADGAQAWNDVDYVCQLRAVHDTQNVRGEENPS